ncbi:hypothetical protein TNCV_2167691 [Trichonephila clavipes]|nr:hypothetical protein TNCV_2167691 [Trichonephila clavipes]
MFEKVSVLLDGRNVLGEEFVAIDDDNVRVQPQLHNIRLGVCSKLKKNVIETVLDEEIEMNNATPVHTSSKIRNMIKSMHCYLDVHSNDENSKMEDIKQFDSKKDNAEKIS